MVKAKNLLLYGTLGAVAVYAVSKISTGLSLKKLNFYRPRIKFGKISLTNMELVITLDIENPGNRDVALEYFTGDLTFNSKRLSSFTFNSNQQVILKSRQITAVPFTVIVSNLSALSVLANLIKAISSNTPIAAVIGVTGTIYAGGNDYDVKFDYDVKKQAVAGIGGRRKAIYVPPPAPVTDSPYTDAQPTPAPVVEGIRGVKATLEFASNGDMEKYFTGKRMDKKIMFSKN